MKDGRQRQGRPVASLLHSVRQFAGTAIEIVHTRLQLLTTELQEEVRQVGAILLWAFICTFAAMLGLFLGALAVIFAFWDTHRMTATLGMLALFVVIATGAAWRLMNKLRRKPPLLGDTLAELAKDRDQLRGRS
ncbi:hypothetical protein ACG33_14755 [Steroidobacter denitrificans]|uniref:Membrane protein YqjE n=1 Tax=Steroidobacter denitrificans TaxID=465721 RepID=A0A127FD80_STEDE|nr:phage holin family protein [Steroidobacter denitrificans]AMN48332.1 hypothetical protein ACG33_14755 [Steroidobacter denitrificans]